METPSDNLDSEDKLVWEDILSNRDVPVNDDPNETQKITTNEFIREITASIQFEKDTQAHSSSYWDAEDNEVLNKDIASSGTGSDLEDSDAESADHVTDLTTVHEIVEISPDDEKKYEYYFIDPKNKQERETYRITKQLVEIPYNQSIGHRRPRGVKIRRWLERKRTKINVQLLKAAKV